MPIRDKKRRIASVRRWQRANPEYERARKRRQHTAKSREYAARKARYRVLNLDVVRVQGRVSSARRRARKLAASVPLTPQEQAKVIGIYAEARAMTEIIGIQYHVDHIVPLSKGGLHHPNNLQVLRAVDNLRKGTRVVDYLGRETCG